MDILTQTPDPKFDLWQQTTDGMIVGFYWESVDVVLKEHAHIDPGWFYIMEANGQHVYVYEDDVELVVAKNSPEANAENN